MAGILRRTLRRAWLRGVTRTSTCWLARTRTKARSRICEAICSVWGLRHRSSRRRCSSGLGPAGSDAEAAASELAAFRDECAWNGRFWAAAQARRGKGKAYLYYFTHEPPVAAGQLNRGATHTTEIPYAFNNPTQLWTDVDRRLADTMSSYWVNFAATGDPNGQELPFWPAFIAGKSELQMMLGPKTEAGPASDAARVAVFDALFQRVIRGRVSQTAVCRN